MRRIILTVAALAAVGAPILSASGAASAQDLYRDREERREDRQDYRQDERRAYRDGVVTPGEHRELQRDRRELRQDNRDVRFDRNHPETWRGRPEWRDWRGVRPGFWYAPGYGYRVIEGRWVNRSWHRGDFVPYEWRAYYVQDPFFYGLRPAGPGLRWVYLNGNLALMNLRTGLILDIVYSAY